MVSCPVCSLAGAYRADVDASGDSPDDPEPEDDSSGLDEEEMERALDDMARELFGEPAWDEVLRHEPSAPEEPTGAERLLYALGQLLRLHRAGRLPVHPCELDIEDIIRVLGVSNEFEFVSRNRLGRHYHFSRDVLTASAENARTDTFPWQLLSMWEWAAEQELNSLWLDDPGVWEAE